MDEEKLMEKCKENQDDPKLIKECKNMLNTMAQKDVSMGSDLDPDQSFINMAENIPAEDVPKVLEMALRIAKSSEITDPDLKRDAERLIRAIEQF
ncbi:MAG TPA: hypothetical protein VMC48_03930 [Methanobacterium sp.]|nr:hypothetical protein [Methanobacterium sp.]